MISGHNMGVTWINMAFDRVEEFERRREAMINAALAGGTDPELAIKVADSEYKEKIIIAKAYLENIRAQVKEYENRPRWWHIFRKKGE